MKRRRDRDTVGKGAGRGQRIAATHAVAERADRSTRLTVDSVSRCFSTAAVSRITIGPLIDATMPLNRARSGPSTATCFGSKGANGVRW